MASSMPKTCRAQHTDFVGSRARPRTCTALQCHLSRPADAACAMGRCPGRCCCWDSHSCRQCHTQSTDQARGTLAAANSTHCGSLAGLGHRLGRQAQTSLSSHMHHAWDTHKLTQGAAVAVGLELAMVYAKGIDKEGFEDRAYRYRVLQQRAVVWSARWQPEAAVCGCRLHYHDTQNRTDRFAGCCPAAALVSCCKHAYRAAALITMLAG